MKIKTSQINMIEGNIAKKTILFSIPLLLSGWLQILYSAADLITCGNFGSEYSVGAISATSSITYLFVSLCLGFSVGANVMIAQAYGEKNKEKAEKIIGTAYLLALICEIIVVNPTPITSNLKTITNKKFNPTLIRPEIIKYKNGLIVSPMPLSKAAPKLYIIVNGIPMK